MASSYQARDGQGGVDKAAPQKTDARKRQAGVTMPRLTVGSKLVDESFRAALGIVVVLIVSLGMSYAALPAFSEGDSWSASDPWGILPLGGRPAVFLMPFCTVHYLIIVIIVTILPVKKVAAPYVCRHFRFGTM